MKESVIKLADERDSGHVQVHSTTIAEYLRTRIACAGYNIFSSRGPTAIEAINQFTHIEASRSCFRF